jgi:hypothetical protein
VHSFHSRWGRQCPVTSPWTQPTKDGALEPLEGCIVWGCWQLKLKFLINCKSKSAAIHCARSSSVAKSSGCKGWFFLSALS